MKTDGYGTAEAVPFQNRLKKAPIPVMVVTASFRSICDTSICDTKNRMLKKSIAAALLVAMVAWAEMAMAPMLAMHAGHVHPAREMAESVVRQMAAHHHVMPAGHHPCCPGLGKTASDRARLEFAASSMPCQDQHRCCFLQGPQSVPAPASAGDKLSRDVTPAEIAGLIPSSDAKSHASPATAVAPGPPPGLLDMVFRV